MAKRCYCGSCFNSCVPEPTPVGGAFLTASTRCRSPLLLPCPCPGPAAGPLDSKLQEEVREEARTSVSTSPPRSPGPSPGPSPFRILFRMWLLQALLLGGRGLPRVAPASLWAEIIAHAARAPCQVLDRSDIPRAFQSDGVLAASTWFHAGEQRADCGSVC